jgi:hypothetical protein
VGWVCPAGQEGEAMIIQWILFLLLATAAVVICLWVVTYRAEKQRREQLDAVASHLGFEFSKAEPQLVQSLAHLRLFSQGHSRKAWNVMNGRAGEAKVLLFDYLYVTGGGKSSHTWRQTVILFESGRLQLPAFSLRPQGFWDGIAGIFGQQDIEFEASPEFSSAYLLQGQDEDRVRAIFSEPVVAYFTRHPGLCVEGEEEQLVYYHKGRRIKPAEIPDFFQEGLDVLDLWIQKEGVAENLELIGLDLGGYTIPEVGNESSGRL